MIVIFCDCNFLLLSVFAVLRPPLFLQTLWNWIAEYLFNLLKIRTANRVKKFVNLGLNQNQWQHVPSTYVYDTKPSTSYSFMCCQCCNRSIQWNSFSWATKYVKNTKWTRIRLQWNWINLYNVENFWLF